ncbi:DUF298-domain-containing protein [Panus rudis PR-1116 ss-1]|nr:DUF298-domain-containing protein [Panus rudis PR-1116 ss-1]
MPPKRKRPDEQTTTETKTTRATRSSTRNKAKDDTREQSLAPSASSADPEVPVPQAKRARTKTTASSKKGPARGKASNSQQPKESVDDDSRDSVEGQKHLPDSATNGAAASSRGKAASSKSTKALEPYSRERAVQLFDRYADEDNQDVIGPAGFEKLCSDLDISLEGALPLILAWQFGASEMAKLKKDEWLKFTNDLRISCTETLALSLHELEDLLLLNKPALQPAPVVPTKKTANPALHEPYNRSRYYTYAKNKDKSFGELYVFCFMLVKPQQSRNIDMETASAFWTVLLVPKYPLMQDILSFITEKGTYKGVNKDLWMMVLDFCRTVSPTLEGYEDDGAWPTMLDEFVVWKKAKLDAES